MGVWRHDQMAMAMVKRVFYGLLIVLIGVGLYFFALPPLMARWFPSTASAGHEGGQGANRAAGQGQTAQGTGRRGAPPAAVVVAVASQQTIPIFKTSVGFMEPVDAAVVRARATGLITAVKVVEGQTVKAGDVLFQLDDAAIKIQIKRDQATIARDQAAADFQTADLARAKTLAGQGNDTTQQLQTAQSTADAAAATVALDKAQLAADQLTLSYMSITAPIDGRVGVLNVSNGDTVFATDTSAGGLLTITQPNRLRASFSIPERDLDSYRTALAAANKPPVAISVTGDAKPRATGTLSFIDSTVDPASGSILVKADVDNTAQALWPGQYISASVQIGAYTDATTVPTAAVQQNSNGPFVFTVSDQNTVKQVPVTLIATINDIAIVGPEVSLGEKVVVEGQLALVDGATVVPTAKAAPGTTPAAPPAGQAPPLATTSSTSTSTGN